MKNTNSRLLTAILIPMLLIPLAGYGYAHWTDSVTKKYKIHVVCAQTKIKTNKVLTDWVDDENILKDPSDDELSEMDGAYSLSISIDGACPGFDVWIGLMLHNQGTLPELVHPPTFNVIVTPGVTLEGPTSFTYGIFTGGDFTDYYAAREGFNHQDFRDVLDPDTGIVNKTTIDPPLPRVIDPCNKLVMWTYLKLEDGPEKFIVQIEIHIETEFAF